MSRENKRQVGTKYEKLAGAFLEKQGYEILCYNYRCFFGEIDIVAKEGETLIFCEVKYRSSSVGGNPFEAVDPKKQQIIYRCAMNYLSFEDTNSENSQDMHGREIPCRFDVIGFVGEEIYQVKNAFHG
jgi:putative endonuclease